MALHIELGGKRWAAQMADGGPPEPSRVTTSNDGRERAAQRMDELL